MRSRFDALHGLSGTLWPIHLKPLPDELLSSWIVRLAHAHGYKVQTMSSLLFGRSNTIWNRDIDRLAPAEVGEALIYATGVTIEQFEGTTLRAYEGTLMERHTANGMCRWIVPLGIFHRTRKRPGLMYCSQCLKEDANPYFRRHWRLALSTACTKHKRFLLDSCPKCQAPLAPHRADMQGRQHYPRTGLNVHCWKCGFDLRDSQSTDKPKGSLLKFQEQVEVVLQRGYADWAGNSSMHSLLFFDGLRALIAGITSLQTTKRLKEKYKPSGFDLSTWPRTGLEMAALPLRREVLAWTAVLLENWPINFVHLIRENKLRYAELKGDSEQRPFWYEDVIRREVGGGIAPIGEQEVKAIVAMVEAKCGRFNINAARRLSGRDISAHIADRFSKPISDELYEDLLTSIDHKIAATVNRVERASLIRDKIMFAVGRQLHLSEEALAQLTLEQIRVMVPENVDPDFSDVAWTSIQARAWSEWYWDRMRPQLRPMPHVKSIFTSAVTGRAFRHSAIGMRFQKTVRGAMMQRFIPSYSCWSGSGVSHAEKLWMGE